MGELRDFIKKFFSNQGHYVFLSLLVAKITAFATSLYIIKLLPEREFGMLSIVASLFGVFSSLSGFGSYQGLLRYGSLAKGTAEKDKISGYFLKSGIVYQIFLTAAFLVPALFYARKYGGIVPVFLFFAVRLLGYYFYLHVQSDLRIRNENRLFARLNNWVNIGGMALTLGGAAVFGLQGYLAGLCLAPFLSLFWMKGFPQRAAPVFPRKELWNYSVQAAVMSVLSDFLFALDVLLMSFLLSDVDVAQYKVAIFIPSNITFLSLTFMQSDFPLLARHYRDQVFLKNYIKNYYRIFIPLGALIFMTGWLFSGNILALFFKAQYASAAPLFVLFLLVFVMNMLFRNLFGNLISAVGKVKVNTVVSLAALGFLAVSGYFLTKKFGVAGMAAAQSLTLVLTGLAFSIYFFKYYKNLK